MRTKQDYPDELFSPAVVSALQRAILLANREDGGGWQDFILGVFGARPCSIYAVQAAYSAEKETAESLMQLYTRLPDPGPHDIEFWIPGTKEDICKWLEF